MTQETQKLIICAILMNHPLQQIPTYFWKISLTACSLAPIYFESNSGPFTDINLIPHCLAAAAAKTVFPDPGGPYNSNPDCNLRGAPAKILGY